MIRLYRFALSTNAERVALALAHKRLPVESVEIDPADRSEVRRVSGQDLVPVIEDDGRVIFDSFIDWFNRVWKRPPNAMEAEMGKPQPDRAQITAWGREMAQALDLFEGLLTGRDFLLGDGFSAADVAAFPFLKYALDGEARLRADNDRELFHKILVDYQPLGGNHPRLSEWIRRVDRLPRA
jgi:glutathione S-transferase